VGEPPTGGDAKPTAQNSPAEDEPIGLVTLRDAVAAALLRNPSLDVASWEVRVREARAVQAGLLPNPELGAEVENVGGSGDREAFEQSETTAWLSQLIQLGGKREKRRRVAELERELSEWDYKALRLGVVTETRKAFVGTLVGQKQLSLVEELERVASASLRSIERQVEAGTVSAIERSRAEVVLSSAQVERQRVSRALAVSRTALAASWGSTVAKFEAVTGELSDLQPPPPLLELEGRLEENPDIARWGSELEQRRATLSLARAGAIPDPTVSVGGRHFGDNDDVALVFGLSLPLPLFDRKQGDVLAARRQLAKARSEKASAELFVGSMLRRRYEDLVSGFEQADTLRSRTLPAATLAFDGARENFRKGLFRFIDVLDSQRTLFELRSRHLAAVLTYYLAQADIERLTGGPLYEEGRAK